MKRLAIVYYSKYGATKKYAQYIAKQTGGELLDAQKCNVRDLMAYDTIVYGGGIYSGGIKGIELITKNLNKKLAGRRILVFAVGITVESEENRKQCLEINFGNRPEVTVGEAGLDQNSLLGQLYINVRTAIGNEPMEIPCYFFPGAYDGKKLKGLDKAIIKVTRNMMGDAEDAGLAGKIVRAIDEGCDWVDETCADDLIKEIEACGENPTT